MTEPGASHTAALDQLVERALSRILAQPIKLIRLDRLSAGASQETYRVEIEIDGAPQVLALRRSAGGREHDPQGPNPGLLVEADLFVAARNAGIPEPQIKGKLTADDGLGPGFFLEWLDGETLGSRIVRSDAFDTVRATLARQCGEILARIHAIDVAATGLDQQLQTQTAEQFVRDTWARYQELDSVQPMIDYTALWLLDNLPADTAPRLVHNDFRNGNLMISAEHGVTGVLDWELAYLGDPMRDLGWICCNSWRFGGALPVGGFGTREDLFAGYESVSGAPVDPEHVRFWEVFGSFWWAVSTLTMANANRLGHDPSVERVAVGRRTSECQMDCVNLLFPGPFELDQAKPEPTELAHRSELVDAVMHLLRTDVMAETQGRVNFLSRVAANALDIVQRELVVGEAHRSQESSGLAELGCEPSTGPGGDRGQIACLLGQRQQLIDRLKDGSIALDDPRLQAHLRQTAAQQLAIDQPKYSALRR